MVKLSSFRDQLKKAPSFVHSILGKQMIYKNEIPIGKEGSRVVMPVDQVQSVVVELPEHKAKIILADGSEIEVTEDEATLFIQNNKNWRNL